MTSAAGFTKIMLTGAEARRRQTLAAFLATIGGFLFGYDTGVISGALLYMSDDLNLSVTEESVIVSCLLVGAAFGAAFGGRISDSIGRRRLIWVAAILFIIGTVGSALAPGITLMIISRVILGLAVGGVSAVVPLYIGEIAPVDRRGRLVNQNEVMIVTGQLAASVINAILSNTVDDPGIWRWMLGIALIPAIGLFVATYLLPDSPRFLVRNDRLDEARSVLHQLRTPEVADSEYEHMAEAYEERRKEPQVRPSRYLAYRWVRVLIVIGIGLSLCQQLAGVNAIVYYAPTLLTNTGVAANAAVLGSIAIGVMGVIAVSIGMYLVGRVDRRPMLITGQAGAVVCHVVIAILFLTTSGLGSSWTVLAMMVVLIFFQQCFISTVTWLALSELFPMRVRGFAMGISVFFQWAANFLVSLLFPNVASAYGPAVGFGGFAVLTLLGLIFVWLYLPETRGESLEHLERTFKRRYAG